ncbi:MAG: hypothetical protein HY550_06915 [Elusimicrobia bacterium]|nr:hypothetical protein [Elusimicrobiota bacterium]
MANDYNELEQLVNDVTSLDTARMTLRWALERLNNIEKEKADLKKNLTLAEETARRLQVKEASLTDAYTSRNKTIEEKEDFYTKLEATMSLLGEGKLDIQQLLKKEAKLDSLRHSLEAEYSDKFEELDRNQRSVIERWNSRLLEVESQYAGRLAEAQKKYDGLRAELEGEYQGRMNSLQADFRSREKFLSERVAGLESSVLRSEEKVEARRGALEAEYLQKKREAEENYRKLKNLLEAGLEEKLRAADSDHAEQVRAFEASWQIERARLLQEQHVREAQYASAQDRIKEIENALAAQQEAHHNELLKIITEKETAFRAQLAGLEAEKAAKEETVRELQGRLEKRSDSWEADRSRLQAEFDGRLSSMEAGLRERAAALENAFADRRKEIEKEIESSRAAFEKEFDARLQAERQSMDAQKDILEGEKLASEEALAAASARLKELEHAVTATREEHHKDLLERLRAGEASFRDKLAGFEAEKQAYNETINKLADELRRREAEFIEEKKSVYAEFDAKVAMRIEVDRGNWLAERVRLEATLAETSAAFRAAQKEIEGFNARQRQAEMENAGREDRYARELLEAKAGYEKELTFRVKESVAALTSDLVRNLDASLSKQAELSAALEASESSVRALTNAAAEAARDNEAKRISAISEGLAVRRAELEKAYAAKQAAFEEDYQTRLEEISSDFDLKSNRLAEDNAVLRKEIEKQDAAAAQAKAGAKEMAEKLLAAEKAFHDEKVELQKAQIREFDASVGDAVAAAVELAEDRLRHSQEELEKMKKTNREEVGLLREGFEAEKDQLLEELGRRDRYIESADEKLQELEHTMLKYRQNASGELMRNIAEQDARFREQAAEEKARGDARIRQLESLLAAKEKLLADSDKFYRQKQLELDGLHAGLNMRLNGFNEDMFAQKQELGEKEKALNEFRLKLEKDYAIRNSELEKLKGELARAIIEYRKK